MRTAIVISVVGFALACLAADDDAIIAHVKGDRVNLRGRPEANGEVVGQAVAGDALKVVQNGDLWVGISPPEKVRCWIHKDFVQDGKVTVKELTVRAGASINYPKVGSLFRGDAVTPRETFGEWLCIPPPTNAVVWIHRELLDLPSETRAVEERSAASSSPAPAVTGVATDATVSAATDSAVAKIAPSVPTAVSGSTTPITHQAVVMPPHVMPGTAVTNAPLVPADLNLVPLPGQGTVVQHEGFVKPSPYLLAPGKYRLAVKKGSQLETVCFLRGNSRQLADLVDQYFAIQGPEYWVQGVREPLLIIERIERRSAPGSQH